MTTPNVGIAYGRNYSLIFRPLERGKIGEEPAKDITFIQEGQINFDRYEPSLAIQFSVNKTFPASNTTSTQKAVIRIYNLTSETARAIQVPGLFTLLAGHDRNQTEIFSGVLSGASYGIEGNDTFVELNLIDGDIVYVHRFFQKSYAAGTALTQILGDLADFIMNTYYPKTGIERFDYTEEIAKKRYNKPITIQGDAISELAKLLPKYYVYLIRRKIRIRPRISRDNQSVLSGPSVVFNPDHGQIGYVRPIGKASTENNRSNYDGIECQSILNPDIDLGTIIQVLPSELQNRYQLPDDNKFIRDYHYQVTSVSHEGNSFQGNWITTWQGELINTVAEK